ncbi:MAG: UDP-2,4-diacetamido-2,4,6-trideoxy-beta-L-altropyranose hydrolase [Lachnospiraceae bacterium]|nr:UDP-2,4-diacetamido-2,4,6-trideoxy-beta-L-altropyranose hydrolase [Lachnospiraceae bacterium]
MKVIIRADANSNIGQGHVMRCLSLCDALKEKGHECVFVCAKDTPMDFIMNRGYDVYYLTTSYNRMDDELALLEHIIAEEKADLLIIDSYYVSANYLQSVKEHIKTVYLDDVYSFAYDVDCLVNYNVYADEEKYREMYMTEKVKIPEMIIGPTYAPLRKEFTQRNIKEINEIRNIMISVGGADPLNLAYGFADKFSKNEFFKDKNINMILGKMEPDIEKIKDICEATKNINYFVNVKDMKEKIEEADIVISAAGSTQYEICACGKPCICFSMADNQVPGGEKFGELGAFIYAGDARDNECFFYDVLNAVKRVAKDPALAKEMSRKASEITDGHGAERIVGRLEKLFGR